MPGKDWNRRAVLTTAMSASAAVVTTTRAWAQVAVPWSVGTELPKTEAPPNAADCHHHIYSSRFKVDPNSTL
jgi:D-galactarolactone isomerase